MLSKPKRLLTDKELEEYLKLEKESKKKEYLLKLKEELFEEYEFERRKK